MAIFSAENCDKIERAAFGPTPETVVKNYQALSDDDVDTILHTQRDWFFTQIKEFKDKGLEL